MQKVDITKLPVVLTLPGMSDVSVRRDLVYSRESGESLRMDIYYPPKALANDALGVVILVTGHADPVIEAAVGCKLKDSESYISWARLIAASGVIAITYTNREPLNDIASLLEFLDANAQGLGIDVSRTGLWSCSANVPCALSQLMSERKSHRCAAFLYGFMLDSNGRTFVADAAAQSGFAAPNANKTIDDIRSGVALRIVRAGADQIPGINKTIDDFCAGALKRNLPITLVNHPEAPHSFDIFDDSESTKAIIQDVLDFFVLHLSKDR